MEPRKTIEKKIYRAAVIYYVLYDNFFYTQLTLVFIL